MLILILVIASRRQQHATFIEFLQYPEGQRTIYNRSRTPRLADDCLFASGHHRPMVDILGMVWFESGGLLYFAIKGLGVHDIW